MKNFIFGFVFAMWAGPTIKATVVNVARSHTKESEEHKHEHQS